MATERFCPNMAIIEPREVKATAMSFIYAVGDIHGSWDKLARLMARCEQHAGGRAVRFVFLGDYIDRGPESATVIDFLIGRQSDSPESIITLMGNHEAMLLGAIDGTMSPVTWLQQGGAATLQSYGVADVRKLPRAHVDWLRMLRLTHDDGQRFFVHAGVDPELPLDAQSEMALLWIREPFLSDPRDYGRLMVHGHTPVRTGMPDLRPNRLNLDTGAVFGGPLTAAVFEETQARPISFIQAE
jgi:Calcineurin-like phosphoesterase